MKIINFITYLLVLIIVSCSPSQTVPIYYNISFESNSNFPIESSNLSNSIVKVNHLDGKKKIYIIKDDSICQSIIYPVINDTIIGRWNTVEEYTYRLIFPELNIKARNIKAKFNETLITEIRNKDKWTMYKEWGFVLKSNISGTIEMDKGITTLKTTALLSTPAMLYSNKSITTIEKIDGFELDEFDLKWKDCM